MLPKGFSEFIGRGPKVQVDGKDYEAYPLTVEEYLEYLGMRPDCTVSGTKDAPVITYANPVKDHQTEMRASAYVVYCTLRKHQDASGASFSQWLADTPAPVLMALMPLVGPVIAATLGPIQKKN